MPCMFVGSYYNPTPWTDSACISYYMVPAGCPMYFATGAPIGPSSITAYQVSGGGTGSQTPVASTATLVDATTDTYVLPDEGCACTPTNVPITIQRFAVMVPSAVEGDWIRAEFPGDDSGAAEFMITAAGICPTPEAPQYEIALACDRCPSDPAQPPPPPAPAGCAVGSDPSLALIPLALASLARGRRRRSYAARTTRIKN